MSARIGSCCAPSQTVEFADLGFDFVEWPMRSTVGTMSEDEYTALRKQARDLPLVPEAWNVMLPTDLKVVGPEADHEGMVGYLESALGRASELGGSIVVFGSGPSRAVPDGWPREDAFTQFEDGCLKAGEVARKHGIILAIEPLPSSTVNLVNSVAEGARIVDDVGHPNVKLLADLGHVVVEGEAFEDTTAAGSVLVHVHVALPHSREIPLPNRGGAFLREYFQALQAAHYEGRISAECEWSSTAELAEGLAFMRAAWAEAESAS